MSSYLDFRFEDSPAQVSAFDEAPLWSAAFGLLLFDHLPLANVKRAVDLGCGTGFPLIELASRLGPASTVIGIDPWANAVARARQKLDHYGLGHVQLITASAEKIPLESASVDLIVSNLGINNFKNPDAVMQECLRILKSGGVLALTTNLNPHWPLFYETLEAALRTHELDASLDVVRQEQLRRGSEASVTDWLARSGLQKIVESGREWNMRFASGTAFLNHHFVKLGWVEHWVQMVPADFQKRVFDEVEQNLNEQAMREGNLYMRVNMLYAQGQKPF